MLVPGAALDFADELLDRVPDGRAGGQPVRQPGAYQRVRVEQAELAAQLTMVVHHALLSLEGEVLQGERPTTKAPGRSPRGLAICTAVNTPGWSPASSWRQQYSRGQDN